ncbi:MAG: phage/plasmid primase, P4 family [Candidatus Bathyarchaeia archaeon]
MTEQQITPKEMAELHLEILGSRSKYHVTAKNYARKDDILNDFLAKDQVFAVLSNWNEKGYTTWISINDKEKDSIEGVTALCDFWLDFDARPKGIDDRPATNEEKIKSLEKAEKLKDYLAVGFNAEGFLAASGNGFHIHYPLPRFELPLTLRSSVNKKVRAFAKAAAKYVNVEIDKTYDISRRTTLIGTENKKLPSQPLKTGWNKEIFKEGLSTAKKWVEAARTKNKQLLDAILETPEENPKKALLPTETHIDIEELLRTDQKLYDLYKLGDYSKYQYKSRSEAEEAVLVKLSMEGFNDNEICALMENCALGKWQEKGDSYHTLSLQHAREQATVYLTEKKEKSTPDAEEINPIVLAKEIQDKYDFVLEDLSDTLYYRDVKERIYSNKTKRLLNREIAQVLDEETRTRYYPEVENWIKSTSEIRTIDENPELLAVQNGILNVVTRELKEFTPALFITRKLKWKYDPNAKCPKIDAFKLKILPEENKCLLAQEYEGYCLYGDLIFKKAYLANGKTDTGKTVHQNILTAFLGEENLSHQTIQALNHNRFSPAELFGKMGNFVDDLPSSIVKTTGFFKMALGHGTIPAERKGKDPFNFKNKAKFWINANDLPPIAKWEDTDAYFNRLLINDYEVQIPLSEQNPNLIYELTTPEEMSGFLNQALDGWKRLSDNKKFTYGKTQEETRLIYTKRSDAAKWFVETFLKVTDEYENFVYHDDIFRACVKICHEEQIKKIPTPGELTKAIEYNCTGARSTRIRKIIGYDDKKKKDLVKFEPSWRYLKLVIPKEAKTPEEPEQDPKQAKLSIVKDTTVQTVRVVQGIQNSLAKIENKNSKKENEKDTDDLKKVAQTAQTAQKKRFCSVECANFDKKECCHPAGWANLNKQTELPCKCPGYSYIGAPEE